MFHTVGNGQLNQYIYKYQNCNAAYVLMVYIRHKKVKHDMMCVNIRPVDISSVQGR